MVVMTVGVGGIGGSEVSFEFFNENEPQVLQSVF